MKKILFIVGSLRKNSFNRQLSAAAKEALAGKAEVTYLDITQVPFVNQDIEFPAPEAVTAIREAGGAADALWIFTPEYNFSYPAPLKNTLDWLSRPVVAGDYEHGTVLTGKPVAISGAAGKSAAGGARKKLTELLKMIGTEPIEDPQVGIVLDGPAFMSDKLTLTDENKAALAAEAEALLAKLD